MPLPCDDQSSRCQSDRPPQTGRPLGRRQMAPQRLTGQAQAFNPSQASPIRIHTVEPRMTTNGADVVVGETEEILRISPPVVSKEVFIQQRDPGPSFQRRRKGSKRRFALQE